MNRQKFAQMVQEFPFLTKILTERNLSADSIGSIEVMRGDRNLLEITPSTWAHDADQYGSHEGHRLFWCIAPGEINQLESSRSRSIPYERNDQQGATPIGSQLLSLNRDVLFIVEIHAEGWDGEDKTPHVVIYKMMREFNWRSYARPTRSKRTTWPPQPDSEEDSDQQD